MRLTAIHTSSVQRVILFIIAYSFAASLSESRRARAAPEPPERLAAMPPLIWPTQCTALSRMSVAFSILNLNLFNMAQLDGGRWPWRFRHRRPKVCASSCHRPRASTASNFGEARRTCFFSSASAPVVSWGVRARRRPGEQGAAARFRTLLRAARPWRGISCAGPCTQQPRPARQRDEQLAGARPAGMIERGTSRRL